jgi:hypothetical protein
VKIDSEIAARVQKALEHRALEILASEGGIANHNPSTEAEREWNICLEGSGARRIGKLMGMIVQPEAGFVRFKDPLGNGGNYGFVEMDEDTLNKVATLGLP